MTLSVWSLMDGVEKGPLFQYTQLDHVLQSPIYSNRHHVILQFACRENMWLTGTIPNPGDHYVPPLSLCSCVPERYLYKQVSNIISITPRITIVSDHLFHSTNIDSIRHVSIPVVLKKGGMPPGGNSEKFWGKWAIQKSMMCIQSNQLHIQLSANITTSMKYDSSIDVFTCSTLTDSPSHSGLFQLSSGKPHRAVKIVIHHCCLWRAQLLLTSVSFS